MRDSRFAIQPTTVGFNELGRRELSKTDVPASMKTVQNGNHL